MRGKAKLICIFFVMISIICFKSMESNALISNMYVTTVEYSVDQNQWYSSDELKACGLNITRVFMKFSGTYNGDVDESGYIISFGNNTIECSIDYSGGEFFIISDDEITENFRDGYLEHVNYTQVNGKITKNYENIKRCSCDLIGDWSSQGSSTGDDNTGGDSGEESTEIEESEVTEIKEFSKNVKFTVTAKIKDNTSVKQTAEGEITVFSEQSTDENPTLYYGITSDGPWHKEEEAILRDTLKTATIKKVYVKVQGSNLKSVAQMKLGSNEINQLSGKTNVYCFTQNGSITASIKITKNGGEQSTSLSGSITKIGKNGKASLNLKKQYALSENGTYYNKESDILNDLPNSTDTVQKVYVKATATLTLTNVTSVVTEPLGNPPLSCKITHTDGTDTGFQSTGTKGDGTQSGTTYTQVATTILEFTQNGEKFTVRAIKGNNITSWGYVVQGTISSIGAKKNDTVTDDEDPESQTQDPDDPDPNLDPEDPDPDDPDPDDPNSGGSGDLPDGGFTTDETVTKPTITGVSITDSVTSPTAITAISISINLGSSDFEKINWNDPKLGVKWDVNNISEIKLRYKDEGQKASMSKKYELIDIKSPLDVCDIGNVGGTVYYVWNKDETNETLESYSGSTTKSKTKNGVEIKDVTFESDSKIKISCTSSNPVVVTLTPSSLVSMIKEVGVRVEYSLNGYRYGIVKSTKQINGDGKVTFTFKNIPSNAQYEAYYIDINGNEVSTIS